MKQNKTCSECKYFSVEMVCYGNEPIEKCECLKGNEEINEYTDICEEFELMEKENDRTRNY